MSCSKILSIILVGAMTGFVVTAQEISSAVLSSAAGAAVCTQFITVGGNVIENCLTEVVTVPVTVTAVAPVPSSLGAVSSQMISSVSSETDVPPVASQASASLPSEQATSHRTPTAAFISSTSDAVTHLTPTAAFISSTSIKCAACEVLNSALASYSMASGAMPSAALSTSISSIPTEVSSISVESMPSETLPSSIASMPSSTMQTSIEALPSSTLPTSIETMPSETFSDWEEEPEETGIEGSDDTDTEGDEDPIEETEDVTDSETSEGVDPEPMRLLLARVPVVPLFANSSIAMPSATLPSEAAVTHRTPTAAFISSVTRRTPTAAFISSTLIDSSLPSAPSMPSAGSPSNLPDDPPFANSSIVVPSIHAPETFVRSATAVPVNWNTSSTSQGPMVVKTMTVTNTVFVNPPSAAESAASIVNSTSICHSAAGLSTSLAGLITQISDGQIQGPVPTTMSLPPGAPSGVPQGVPQGVPEGMSRGLPSGGPHPGVHSFPGNATITKAHGIPKPSHFSMPPHSYRGNITLPRPVVRK